MWYWRMVASESGDVLIISKTAVVIGPIEVVGIKQANKASDAYPPPESYARKSADRHYECS